MKEFMKKNAVKKARRGEYQKTWKNSATAFCVVMDKIFGLKKGDKGLLQIGVGQQASL